MPAHHLLVFDAYAAGHHGQYIQMLLDYWVSKSLSGRLDVVVPSHFPSVFPGVVDYARRHTDAGITISSIPDEPELKHGSPVHLIPIDRAHGRMIRTAIQQRRPDHCLLMYFDHAQLSLWTDLQFDYDVKISGIYFRPSFHYASIGSPPTSIADRLVRLRKRLVLARALKNRHLHKVLSLDPFAVSEIDRLAGKPMAVALPDGVELNDMPINTSVPWSDLGSRDEKVTALLFGGLNRRKGVIHVLESLSYLDVEVQSRLRLALTGPVPPNERDAVYSSLERARALTGVDIFIEDNYVSTERAQSYMTRADVILIAYQRHVGSSNVLVRAAAAEKPVIGSDFGVVGEQIRRNTLGLAVDTTSPVAIAESLTVCVEHPQRVPFNRQLAKDFANSNSAEAFAATIFKHVYRREGRAFHPDSRNLS